MKFILITYKIRYKIRYSKISYEFDRYNKSLIVIYKISFEISSSLMFKNVFPKCLFSKSHGKYGLWLIELALLKFFNRKSLIALKSRGNFQYLQGTIHPSLSCGILVKLCKFSDFWAVCTFNFFLTLTVNSNKIE